jgi:hypothetical protein
LLSFSGKTREKGVLHKIKNKSLGVEAFQYTKEVSFEQKVQLKGKVKTNVSGSITYQVCTDEKCLPPKTVPFTVQLE